MNQPINNNNNTIIPTTTSTKKVTFSHYIHTQITSKVHTDKLTRIKYPWHTFTIELLPKHFDVFVSHVQVFLHESYKQPQRIIRPPFVLQDRAWGNYQIEITVHFLDSFYPPLKLPPLLLKFIPSSYEEQRAFIFRCLPIATKLKYFATIKNGPNSSSSSSYCSSVNESLSGSTSSVSSVVDEPTNSASSSSLNLLSKSHHDQSRRPGALLHPEPETASPPSTKPISVQRQQLTALKRKRDLVTQNSPKRSRYSYTPANDQLRTPTTTIARNRHPIDPAKKPTVAPNRPNTLQSLASLNNKVVDSPLMQLVKSSTTIPKSVKSPIGTLNQKPNPAMKDTTNPTSSPIPVINKHIIDPTLSPKPNMSDTAISKKNHKGPMDSLLISDHSPKPALPKQTTTTPNSLKSLHSASITPANQPVPTETSVIVPGSGGIRLRKTVVVPPPQTHIVPKLVNTGGGPALSPTDIDRQVLTSQLSGLSPVQHVELARKLYKVGMAAYQKRDGIYVYFCGLSNSLIVDLGEMPQAGVLLVSKVVKDLDLVVP